MSKKTKTFGKDWLEPTDIAEAQKEICDEFDKQLDGKNSGIVQIGRTRIKVEKG